MTTLGHTRAVGDEGPGGGANGGGGRGGGAGADALRARPHVRRGRRAADAAMRVLLGGCGAVSILTTLGIAAILLVESQRFFSMPGVSAAEFATGTTWAPLLGSEKHFGVLPLVCGTMLVTVVAAVAALPLGLVTAIFLSEYCPRGLRTVLKPVLEVLAGVPTVVYGYFALGVITPFLQANLNGVEGYNALSAGLAVGIMTLPIVSSLSEDALRAVPVSLREGAYAVGATKFDVSTRIVLPAALSGVIASYLLAIARAVGETMIVALAAGGMPQLTADPRHQVQTMTGFMVNMFLGDATSGGLEYQASYAVAAVLFVMTLLLTYVGHRVTMRFREVYQ